MATLAEDVAAIRDSLCGVMRLVTKTRRSGKYKTERTEFQLAFTGTAWCISDDRYVATAHHVLNGGKPRDPSHRFYIFTVPGNGATAYCFPVTGFPVENAAADLAILEIGPSIDRGRHILALPVTTTRPADGDAVMTYGFPAPGIEGANVDEQGNFLGGGQFFLKGHANEGIVAAQYQMDGQRVYEFNIGWHHGESGGPVVQRDPLAVFAVMQFYRNIKSPNGVLVGPHCGRGLDAIRQELIDHGAKVI